MAVKAIRKLPDLSAGEGLKRKNRRLLRLEAAEA